MKVALHLLQFPSPASSNGNFAGQVSNGHTGTTAP
jgi:hypothetical protein